MLVPVVFAVAGLLFATSAGAARGTDLRGGERTDLPGLVRQDQRQIAEMTAQVAALRTQVDRLGEEAAQRDAPVEAARRQADALGRAVGLDPVRGPALRVVLDDAPPGQNVPGAAPDALVVHQQDLQAVVNAMWAGGAEAMQLMDQRVISTSAVRCAGNVLILQGRTYSPPYTVTAIGDVAGMRAALAASPTVAAYRYDADRLGLGYDVRTLGAVTLPGFQGGLDLAHAWVPADATPSGATPSGATPDRATSDRATGQGATP
ncbi:MAG: DUF881 domain-containing protein [Motilibacteraceae bacterium]